jgi:hypothetical protein
MPSHQSFPPNDSVKGKKQMNEVQQHLLQPQEKSIRKLHQQAGLISL